MLLSVQDVLKPQTDGGSQSDASPYTHPPHPVLAMCWSCPKHCPGHSISHTAELPKGALSSPSSSSPPADNWPPTPAKDSKSPELTGGPAPWRTTKHVTRRQDTRLGLERWAAWGGQCRLPATASSQLVCGGPSEKGAQTL